MTLVVFLAAALVSQTPSVARGQSSEALQACARIEDEEVRLSCFDAAARAATAEATDRERVVEAPQPRSTGSRAPQLEPARGEPPARERQTSEAASPTDTFGLNERPDVPQSVSVVVVNVRTTTSGTALFETESRQVWLQTSTRTRRYPKTPFAATVEQGAVGSFFLTPDEGGLAIRVRRLQ